MSKKPLDKVDLELMALLFQNGRLKLSELGMMLKSVKGSSMSHVAVQKRLKKLLANETIKIQANANVAQLEYVSAFVLIESKGYESQKRLVERFRRCPRVIFFDLVSGKYNVVLRAMAPSLKELECFLNYSWLKKEEIRNIEVMISSTNVKPIYIPIPLVPTDELQEGRAPCGSRCSFCDHYKTGECKGCPGTTFCNSK